MCKYINIQITNSYDVSCMYMFSTLMICVCLYTIWYTVYIFSIEQVGCPWLFISRKVPPQKKHPQKIIIIIVLFVGHG